MFAQSRILLTKYSDLVFRIFMLTLLRDFLYIPL